MSNGAIWAYCGHRFVKIDYEDAHEFLAGVSSLTGLTSTDPRLELYRRLQDGSKFRRNIARNMCLIYKAWNSFRSPVPGRRLMITSGPDGKINIPEPI